MFDILAVCQANVCRSPSIQQLLLTRLAPGRIIPPRLISIASGGFAPSVGAAPCTRIMRGELSSEALAAFEQSHVAREVTPGELEGANLVLTAGLVERASSVRLDVSVRERTFTLVEAALLAEHVLEGAPVPLKLTGTERLHWLVREMDMRRGSLALTQTRRRRPWTRPWASEEFSDLDLPDPHTSHAVTHSMLQKRMLTAVDSLANSLTVTLTPIYSVRVGR